MHQSVTNSLSTSLGPRPGCLTGREGDLTGCRTGRAALASLASSDLGRLGGSVTSLVGATKRMLEGALSNSLSRAMAFGEDLSHSSSGGSNFDSSHASLDISASIRRRSLSRSSSLLVWAACLNASSNTRLLSRSSIDGD